MKKFALFAFTLLFTTCISYAYPNIDYSFSAAPFTILQQHEFERNELQDYKYMQMNKDQYEDEVNDQPAIPTKSRTQFNLKNYNNEMPTEEELYHINSKKNFINENGKIKIKSIDY